MEKLTDIMPPELPEDQQRLLDLIGPEPYAKLIEYYGGMLLYIPKRDGFVRAARNEQIKKEFNGANYRHLAVKYNLSEVMIRAIVADLDQEMRKSQVDGQETIF
jgi:Mor family transcriptional regulator